MTFPLPSTTVLASTLILIGRGKPFSSVIGMRDCPELLSRRALMTALAIDSDCSAGLDTRKMILLLLQMLVDALIRSFMGDMSLEGLF